MIWPELIAEHGEPRHFQNQGIFERAEQNIQKIFFNWMNEWKSNHWNEGFRFKKIEFWRLVVQITTLS